jgi:hypothetical protein
LLLNTVNCSMSKHQEKRNETRESVKQILVGQRVEKWLLEVSADRLGKRANVNAVCHPIKVFTVCC